MLIEIRNKKAVMKTFSRGGRRTTVTLGYTISSVRIYSVFSGLVTTVFNGQFYIDERNIVKLYYERAPGGLDVVIILKPPYMFREVAA